jgi:hypothetical protein
MNGYIETFNFRTGRHRNTIGTAWEELDGCYSRGWVTAVPVIRDGELLMGKSRYLSRTTAQEVAELVAAHDGTVEELREMVISRWPQALRSALEV